jgi:hypothetical protein
MGVNNTIQDAIHTRLLTGGINKHLTNVTEKRLEC